MNGVRQVQITFDCEQPRKVAEFWKAVLGYADPPVPHGFNSWSDFDNSLPEAEGGASWACQDPAGHGPRLYFQRVPESKTVKIGFTSMCELVRDSMVRNASPRLKPKLYGLKNWEPSACICSL